MSSRPRRVLVLGLDGCSFDVLRPLADAGELPHLARWLADGVARPLCSTTPPMSFPAWSTFQTGLEPGGHGVFDFTQKEAGAYRIRFSNARDRRGLSLFARLSRASAPVLALGMPATFPPEPLEGLLVAGFDAPVSTGSQPRSTSDPALYERIAARTGPWMLPGLDEAAAAEGWHERAARSLVERVQRKGAFALEALAQLRSAGRAPQLMCVVFSESDTVAHHFWRDHDPASPRHDPNASPVRRQALTAVYRALDAACGELHAAFGEEALCVVVSDHGSGGAARRIVHLGRRLAETGLLRRNESRSTMDALARATRDAALQVLSPRMAERIFRSARSAAARVESAVRFGGHDWRRTLAFTEDVNTQPGVWINLRGREASGCVAPADYERVREDVIAALEDWKLPGAGPVVARARRREDVYAGPHVERAPDIVVELASDAGYGLSLVPTPWRRGDDRSVITLGDDELGGGRGRGMNGTHRQDGVWIAHGEGARAPRDAECPRLSDAAPALLAALGCDWDAGDTDAPRPSPYSAEEEQQVASRLRALGYLE
ncbi:MAG: alkaline phosphatase family protein [Deltaproteobacteria bacterium]|nr:alkaline phosphatase family protein [Deltaproteobacteria bacterium]MBW2360846.1 alkaline phosphatase family protein [Deltaproteobacteria bacterium]